MRSVVVIAGFATLLTSSLEAKRAKDLPVPASGATTRVTVVYKSAPDEKKHQKVTNRKGKLHRQYQHMAMATYDATAEALDDLEKDPDVDYIVPDRPVAGETLNEAVGWAVKMWPTVYTWYSANGNCRGCLNNSPIGIAVIDSGIYAHKDFNWWNSTNSRIVYSESFIGGTPADARGHGTHVAGILAGEGNVSCIDGGLDGSGNCLSAQPFFGMIAGAQLLNLRVLDANGQGSDSAVIAAIDRAVALKATYNVRVINLSLGRPVRESYKTDPLCLAVERAWKAGIVVVVAAGNNGRDNTYGTQGYGTINSPGNDPLVITVGAVNTQANWVDSDDKVTTYSSKGPTMIDRVVKPDLVAPGNNIGATQAIGSALVTQYPANRVPVNYYWQWLASGTPDKYFYLNGTSMATPFVSGAAGLLIDRDRSLTPDQVKARLMKTARRGFPQTTTTYDAATGVTYTVRHDVFTLGAGMLNMAGAWANTEKPTGSAASPVAYYDSATKKVKLNYTATGGTNVLWGDAGSYATNVVWGSGNVSGSTVLWGDNVVWGSNLLTGFNVVWGDTSPYTASTGQAQALGIAINGDK